jgi:hypothetical protein
MRAVGHRFGVQGASDHCRAMTPNSKIFEIGRILHLKSEIRVIKLDSMSVEIAEDRMRDSAGPRKSAPLCAAP